MSGMFEIVPKYPECKECKNIKLELEDNRFFGDGSLLSNSFRITCEHQCACSRWLEKTDVRGDQKEKIRRS